MQLFVSTTSPFARLIMVTAYQEKIDLNLNFILPWENPQDYLTINPFCQVPALLTSNQTLITETSIILQYLTPQIFSNEQTITKTSFSFGLINQAVRAFSIQRFHPENSEPHPFIARSCEFLTNALKNAPQLDPQSDDYGHIFFGIALTYVQLRLPDVFEQAISTANKQALADFLQRDFMVKTDSEKLALFPKSINHL